MEMSSAVRSDPAARPVRLLSAALAVAAFAHVPMTGHHLAEAPYMGAGFVVFTLACLALLLVLPAWPMPPVFATAAVLCGGAIAVYVATRLVAFPLLAHDVGAWTDPFGVTAVTAETVAAIVALRLARTSLPTATVPAPVMPSRV